jgi:hypothetical protein
MVMGAPRWSVISESGYQQAGRFRSIEGAATAIAHRTGLEKISNKLSRGCALNPNTARLHPGVRDFLS